MACSATLMPFPSLAFCLCCSSSGKCNAASLEIVRARLSSPNVSLVLGGSFKPHTLVEAMAAAIRALGHAKMTKQTFCHTQKGQGGGQRCCSRPSMGSCCQLCRGMCWAHVRGWEGADGSWKLCLSCWSGAPFGSSVRCGQEGWELYHCLQVCARPRWDTRTCRKPGIWGSQGSSLQSSPSLQQNTAGHQPNCCLCQNKNWGAQNSQRAPSKTSA